MNTIKLAMIGRDNIATQLDEGHRIGVRKHNKEVDTNRHVLSKIIDRVKLIYKSLIFSLTVIVVLCFLIIPGKVAQVPMSVIFNIYELSVMIFIVHKCGHLPMAVCIK